MLRIALIGVVSLVLVQAAWAEGEDAGEFVVLTAVGPEDPYHAAAERLAAFHRTKHVLAFDVGRPEAVANMRRFVSSL